MWSGLLDPFVAGHHPRFFRFVAARSNAPTTIHLLPRVFMVAWFRSSVVAALGLSLPLAGAARAAGSYDFLAAPQIDLNRIFRLDKATGEIGACQFGLKEGSPGVTLCYPPGQGAGPQGSSDYALVSSRHEGEGGVWRVDLRTGMMSICYVLSDAVVCTPLAR